MIDEGDGRLLHQVMKPGEVEPGNWKSCLFSEGKEFYTSSRVVASLTIDILVSQRALVVLNM
jgi:hypothetical protein